MDLVGFDRESLVRYTAKQVSNVVPDGFDSSVVLAAHLDETLRRLHTCINAVRMWQQDQFDPLHSSQYCTFLYFWGNTIWRRTGSTAVPLRLFLLNKCLNAIDCFYEINLPDIFLIGHSVGIVLAKATYGNHLVLYQNSTVGKNHGHAPVLEDGVILYPNTAIIGKCHVASRSVIAQGVSVINRNTEPDAVAFQGPGRTLVFKPNTQNIQAGYFRDF